MTLDDYNKNINGVITDLQAGAHAVVMVRLAVEALTMIKQRVQETGTNAQGQKYPPYSTKPILIGKSTFIQQKVSTQLLGSKKKRAQLEWRTINGKRLAILPGGYKKVRDLQGRQTNYIDFSVTNNMWNDINMRSTQTDHQNGVAIIGARQDIEKKKLEGNTKRKGEILDLSDSEIEKLKALYNVDVLEIFKKNGL